MKSNDYKHVLESLINNIPTAIFWKDDQLIFQGCNKQFSEQFGLQDPADIIGKSDNDFPFFADLKEQYNRDDKRVLSGTAKINYEEIQIQPDGSKKTLLVSKVPYRNEQQQIIGILGVYTDISDLKKIEQDLRIACASADAAIQAKNMFLANMSHDIKTPLAGIISTAEVLSQSLSNAQQKNHAADIVQSGLCLLQLMTEIIELSKLEHTASHQAVTFDLQKLINDIIQLIKPALNNKAISFNVSYDKAIPSALSGDRWQLYRVILNLLSNALKFTHQGRIHLSASIAEASTTEVMLNIRVEDTGIGIPLDKQSIIFDEFTRLTYAYDETYKGTGLGLAIVKKFVESMHGKVLVSSTEGQGSCFTCLIPFKIATPSPPIANNHNEATPATVKSNPPDLDDSEIFIGLQVLLVEDNAIAARAGKAILESLGCSVDIADCGHTALHLHREKRYHFIYMDIGLPDMDGCEVSKAIRQQETASAQPIPIVALSAHVDSALKTRCLNEGMNDALTKPLLRNQAKQTLQSFIHNQVKPTLSASTEIIDLIAGAAILGSDIAAAKKTLAMVVEQLPLHHLNISLAYQKKDLEALQQATFKLHCGLLYCSANRLEKAVLALTTAACGTEASALAIAYDHYCNELQRFSEAYAAL